MKFPDFSEFSRFFRAKIINDEFICDGGRGGPTKNPLGNVDEREGPKRPLLPPSSLSLPRWRECDLEREPKAAVACHRSLAPNKGLLGKFLPSDFKNFVTSDYGCDFREIVFSTRGWYSPGGGGGAFNTSSMSCTKLRQDSASKVL
uniref:Uncharacterized protein n=1 Tax=Romanomermis culicivorax TaxID=13658 RepID=A0A915INU4_ROMCU